MIDTLASVIGAIAMAAGGFALVAVVLAVSVWATGLYGFRLWRNVTAIYKFSAIQYWFKRMQENGTHVLRKEHDDSLAVHDDL